ncbi:MAG: DJ-1/PfpI family protein [Pseudomonadota bacterium]
MNNAVVAVLASNGFNEKEFLAVQKQLKDMGVNMKIVSANQGLVNGWDNGHWGHNYAVDTVINTALGVDYDALVIISGHRSHSKLMTTAHTKRFVSSFMMGQKPVFAFGDSVQMMQEIDQLDGRKVSSDAMMVNDMLVTGEWNEECAEMMHSMIMKNDDMKQAA